MNFRLKGSAPRGFRVLGLILGAGASFSTQGVRAESSAAKPAGFGSLKVPDFGDMVRLFSLGRNDEVIEEATQALALEKVKEPRLLYIRGYSERKIGWMDEALSDMSGLGDYAPWPKYESAAVISKQLRDTLALRPPISHDVRIGGKVVFRVYTGEETEFNQTVLAALPKGYAAAAAFIPSNLTAIPVFVFDSNDYSEFVKFHTAFTGSAPHPYWTSLSTRGAMLISQADGRGKMKASDTATMPRTIAHEMTHIMMRRLIGNIQDFPTWFNEGSAQVVAATIEPTLLRENDLRVQRLLRDNAVLPLYQLANQTTFHSIVDDLMAGKQQASPYAQGFSMARYFSHVLQENDNDSGLSGFLTSMRDKSSFEGAMKEATGLSTQQFFDAWLEWVRNGGK